MQKIAEALEGKITVDQALYSSQKFAEREMKRANRMKTKTYPEQEVYPTQE
jgi:ribosomal protein L16/L10AE